jgi:hypothetical protein
MRKFLLASTLLAPLAAHAQTQTCTVPGPAAAAGDTIETFGQQPLSVGTTPNQATSYPQFTNGADLVPFDFFGTSWTDIGETSGNGAVTFNGTGETYGNGLATASQTPAGQTLNGIAFGGGGYYQVTMSGNGPMSFWMNDATTMDTGSSPQDSWIEADIAEFDTTGAYAFTLHNWYSPVGSGNAINANEDGASPPGANYTQPNNYGMLWVPATATTQGSVSFYFNGTQVGNTITWNQYVPGQSAPDNPFAVMDEEHMVPILGAGPGTTATFSDLQVWQSSAADDIGTGAATAAAAQPCSGGTTTMSATPIAAVSASATPAVVGQPLVPQTSLSAVTASAAPAASGQPMTPQNSLSSITGSSGATSSSSGSAASDPASATIIPGQGSLMDSNGNVWTITASGSIEENNTYTPGGGAVDCERHSLRPGRQYDKFRRVVHPVGQRPVLGRFQPSSCDSSSLSRCHQQSGTNACGSVQCGRRPGAVSCCCCTAHPNVISRGANSCATNARCWAGRQLFLQHHCAKLASGEWRLCDDQRPVLRSEWDPLDRPWRECA